MRVKSLGQQAGAWVPFIDVVFNQKSTIFFWHLNQHIISNDDEKPGHYQCKKEVFYTNINIYRAKKTEETNKQQAFVFI